MTDTADKEKIAALSAESMKTAFELYQKLGVCTYEFLQTKQVTTTLKTGGIINLTQKDFLVAILAFCATESLRIFANVGDNKSASKDLINDIILEFRGQLESQLKEQRETTEKDGQAKQNTSFDLLH